eukprot:6849752-Prymnesium_polylepis.1
MRPARSSSIWGRATQSRQKKLHTDSRAGCNHKFVELCESTDWCCGSGGVPAPTAPSAYKCRRESCAVGVKWMHYHCLLYTSDAADDM